MQTIIQVLGQKLNMFIIYLSKKHFRDTNFNAIMLGESFWLRQAYIHFDGRVPLYFIDPWLLVVGETTEVAFLPG